MPSIIKSSNSRVALIPSWLDNVVKGKDFWPVASDTKVKCRSLLTMVGVNLGSLSADLT